MKFKFIGKPTIVVDSLTTNEVYAILQFQKTDHHIIIYVIDDNNSLLMIPYHSLSKFNENWSYMNND